MTQLSPQEFATATGAILSSVQRVIDGKPEAVRAALLCLLAEGHLLIEDVPGVGKTMLARALGASIRATVRRIQFTPDLLPSDITGVSVYNPVAHEFRFTPGAVFSNVVIADEINRASPKTQSALLEAMEERQVSVDGVTRALPDPFFVIATQNPIEMAGTYALPEAQRDRFMMRISMGYPDTEAELAMVRDRETRNPLEELTPVIAAGEVSALAAFARAIHVAPAVEAYAVALAQATRAHPELALGASPRATLQLVRAAKVAAALEGRGFVTPDDLAELLPAVFAHRVIGRRGAGPVEAVLAEILHRVPVPLPVRR